MARVVFSHDDGYVKIYKQNSNGSKGDVLSDEWLYVQDIQMVETPREHVSPRLFAGQNRVTIIGYDRTLNIGKFHYWKIYDWSLASSRTQDYYIEIVFTEDTPYDPQRYKWNTTHYKWSDWHHKWNDYDVAPQTETYTLTYCRYAGQTLATKDINNLSRKFSVGNIT